jgi:hypothetical protein
MIDYVDRYVNSTVDFKEILKHKFFKEHEYELTRYNKLQNMLVIIYRVFHDFRT